jgi:hypothetical protein
MRQRYIGATIVVVLVAAVAWIWSSRHRPEPPPVAQPPAVVAPVPAPPPPPVFASEYYRDVKPILDRRCLVCHGGYDAPCRLRLDSPEGLARGAAQAGLHDEAKMPGPLTRLFVDARDVAEWRDKGFHPVLNEGTADPAANLQNSVLYRMLALKREHPLPEGRLPADFDTSRQRRNGCPQTADFADYAATRPLQGMPFALPGLDDDEFGALSRWLESGAKVAALPPLAADLQKAVTDWERFLNNEDLKSRLMSRYVYEHLFLADLYFGAREPRQFFKLVRSRTPSGQPIDVIASRRPFDDPNVPRVFYRLQPVHASIVAKTHLPYLLDERRMARWREWFLRANYSIDRLPSYAAEVADNPFVAFAALPVQSRYRFMLDDAAFFLGGFAKGPAVRSRAALSVLHDQFWVAFVSPDVPTLPDSEFLARESGNLRLPAEAAVQPLGNGQWQRYADLQAQHLAARDRYQRERSGAPAAVTLDTLWSGDGVNPAAALTVFRHGDNASVVEGLVGNTPRTAWVMDYPMLERLHYLLVAGFDAYGDSSHQLSTRLYLDFLRMEGEANFLAFLPKAGREAERNSWYQGATSKLRDAVYRKADLYRQETGVHYRSKTPKREFFEMLRARLGPAGSRHYVLDSPDLEAPTRAALRKIAGMRGWPASYLPELTYLRLVIRGAPDQVFTLIHNVDRNNVAMPLLKQAQGRPRLDSVTLVPGIVGAYPNAIWVVKDSELPALARRLATLNGNAAYLRLEREVAISRTNPKFWQHSDWLHNIYREREPIGWGVLDFSRYDR